jgi:16S rRNA U1498 N3-methylase RsmE
VGLAHHARRVVRMRDGELVAAGFGEQQPAEA